MIRKVFYEVDPIFCPRCGGTMKFVAFITDFAVIDRIINHLKLSFVAERPPSRTWSIKNSSWLPSPEVNIFHDCLLPQEEVWVISGVFMLSRAS